MQHNIPLKDYTTMRLGGSSSQLVTVHTTEEMLQYTSSAVAQNTPLLILGDGSNIIVGDKGFNGLTIIDRTTGFDIISQTPTGTIVRVASGESWDATVARTVQMGLSGIECLSAIPGRIGAAPVQNIGAYGQEVADTVLELEAYDTLQRKRVVLKNQDCNFSYRKSIFNTQYKHRFIIISVSFALTTTSLGPPFYASLSSYLASHGITDYSPASLRDAVIKIRKEKLPDPALIPNTGSFFKNPMIERWQAEDLRRHYDNPPLFDMGSGSYKVSAGWLIEEAGLRGYAQGGMKVYDKNALVLINQGAESYQELFAIREHIIDTVRDMFRINLEQEPEEVGI
jgi:UDP-N-acetylmuramate dehydrogenase